MCVNICHIKTLIYIVQIYNIDELKCNYATDLHVQIYDAETCVKYDPKEFVLMSYIYTYIYNIYIYIYIYRIYSRISREILGKIICKSLGVDL